MAMKKILLGSLWLFISSTSWAISVSDDACAKETNSLFSELNLGTVQRPSIDKFRSTECRDVTDLLKAIAKYDVLSDYACPKTGNSEFFAFDVYGKKGCYTKETQAQLNEKYQQWIAAKANLKQENAVVGFFDSKASGLKNDIFKQMEPGEAAYKNNPKKELLSFLNNNVMYTNEVLKQLSDQLDRDPKSEIGPLTICVLKQKTNVGDDTKPGEDLFIQLGPHKQIQGVADYTGYPRKVHSRLFNQNCNVTQYQAPVSPDRDKQGLGLGLFVDTYCHETHDDDPDFKKVCDTKFSWINTSASSQRRSSSSSKKSR